MQAIDRQPIKLQPYISETVWGGNRLVHAYGIDPQGHANCAEAWVLSAHATGSSTALNGPFTGQTLRQLFAAQPYLFGTSCTEDRFPVLIKFIDALDDLSIQVHPRDSDAVLLPGEAGKTECWYILEALPGAKLYIGFREALTRAQFSAAIKDNSLMDYVQSFEVKPGDFFFIPAGTLHAIGKGVLLAEVQQSSDTTYRVYDYNRRHNGALRPLHIEQATAVTDLLPYTPPPLREKKDGARSLCETKYFTVEERESCCGFTDKASEDSFVSLLIFEAGAGSLLKWQDKRLPLYKGDSILIPAGAGQFSVEGVVRALLTRV